jgi:hypothetical protein
VLGIAQHPVFQGGTSVVEAGGGRWLRAYGTLSHPNILGAFMVVSMSALGVVMAAAHSWKKQIVLCVMSVFFAAALFFSFSRAELLLFCWSEICSIR